MTIFKYFIAAIAILIFSEASSTDKNTLELEGELTDSKIPLLQKYTHIFLYTPYAPEETKYPKYYEDDALIISRETINPNVRTLQLHTARLLDYHIKEIGSFTKLKSLELPINAITDQGVIYISQLTQLEVLDLSKNKITDEAIKTIATMPNIKFLDISFDKITNNGIDLLKDSQSLEELIIKCTRGITSAKYEEIKEKWKNLKKLKYLSHSELK